MRIAVLAVLPLLLSACGIPTAVVLTTTAVDSVAFVGSGKTTSGHALSAATDKDCSILFGITRGELCKDKPQPDEYARKGAGFRIPKDSPEAGKGAVSSAAHTEPTEMQAVLEPRFFDFDYESAPTLPVTAAQTTQPGATPPSGEKPSKPEWALVLGTFTDERRAGELARQLKPDTGLVTTFIVRGEIHYRVTTRPLKRDQTDGRQLNLAALKLENVKLMPICPSSMQHKGCITLDRTLAAQQAKLP